MKSLSRRLFLRHAGSAAAVVGVPVAASAQEQVQTDPHARLQYHLAGLKQAMQEIDPTIVRWGEDPLYHPNAPELRCRFILTAYNYFYQPKKAVQ